MGYRVLDTYEVYHFEEVSQPSNWSFAKYIDQFLALKLTKSGWPGWVKTDGDKARFIQKVEEKEGLKLEDHDFEKNAGLRQIAKICLNSVSCFDFKNKCIQYVLK